MKKVQKSSLNKLGCEITSSKSLEKKIAKKLSLSYKIEVPIRQKGLSSRGLHLQCLSNVANMVRRYGGQVAIGFIYRDNSGIPQFGRHAVWITPEGKAVCITKQNYYAGHEYSDPCHTNKNGQKCVGFYPTKIYSEEESRNITSPSVKQPLQWDINVVWLAQNAHWGVSQLNRSETDWVETENLTKKVTTSLIRQERPLSESRRSMIKRSNFLKDAA
jgi:hypothetical protein